MSLVKRHYTDGRTVIPADNLNDIQDAIIEAEKNIDAHTLSLMGKADGAYVENGYLFLTSNGEVVAGPIGPFASSGGGGGGAANNATLTVSNTTGWISRTVAQGGSCVVNLSWSSTEDGVPTGDGAMKITVNEQTKANMNVRQGNLEIDLKDYLVAGSNSVKVNIMDVYGNGRTIFFSITAVALSLSSTFDASSAFSGAITYTYVPTGNVEKTVHFILDGKAMSTAVVTASGRQQSCFIPAQSHGVHTFEVYFEANVDGDTIESNHLYYELICLEEGNTNPIVACTFNQTKAEQYATLPILYTVYDPSSLTAEVVLNENGTDVATLTVDRTQQTWSYRPMNVGTVYLTITCGKAKKNISFEVTESSVQVEAETEALALYLSSYGRSNNEEHPDTWAYGDIAATLSGFNFVSDGWQLDNDNINVLRVAGDARVTIPYQIFANDFRTTGKTIEIEFATRNVLNYDAIIMSCFNENRGLKLTAQKVTLKSEQSEISTQYKEDEHVRLSFVVEKRAENRLIYCYINGIMSGVLQYPADDDFSQSSPVGISIGSNDCTMDIYCIRVYDNNLTRFQVLDNWIADTQDATLRVERFTRNAVFDAYGQIVIANLPRNLPYLIIEAEELPQYKGDKKAVTGSYTDKENTGKSFEFEGAEADVQGTSSATYARKNYKIKFKGGFMNGGASSETYKLNDKAIATNVFTFKADVASSEGANNVELARLYNDICPYKTPPQVQNPNVRQGIDGFPIVIFWNDGTNITFVGKYNFNNDKGTPEVFGFDSNDESWEIKNNTSDRVLWKSADYSGTDWQNDFEARHPEDSTNITRLKAFAEWLVSTDQAQATGAAITPVTYDTGKTDDEGKPITVTYRNDTAEYRLAKFRDELKDHAEVDGMVFNYLFTELFLMVDNRAKNAFPTYYDGGKWTILPYDFDTAIGTNNEGALVFSYELEDIDHTASGADVFNGQESVLYINLRQAFFDEIRAMYQTLRSDGKLSYADTEKRFEEHQGKWPEAIFNEDAYFKYLAPLVEDNSAAYLTMLQGSKAEQRKWWLYNRYRYIDSKYNAGDALTDVITVRGYAKSDITVRPYADIYATVKYGSYLVQERALRGSSYTLECPLDNVNDTEIYIYSASQLADVGDLSGLMVGYAEFSMATKLQSLKLGDSSASYSNANLTELYLGNNTLLKTIDVRNCPNLGLGETQQAVDISGCTNIEEVYFDGTSITGLTLPNGGILKTLHLPSTVTNLTIRNQKAITDFTMPSYANISTLRLENVSSVIDPLAILDDIAANSRVRIIGFDKTVQSVDEIFDFYDKLDTMRGLDENGNNVDKAQMSGTIRIDSIKGSELAEMQSRYPTITIAYNSIVSYIYFYDDTGTNLLGVTEVKDGADGVYGGTTPSKAATAQYTYTFAGWSTTIGGSADADALKAVTADRYVYAVYTATVRKYTVRFYNGSTLLQTVNNVPYGGSATYTGATPEKGDADYVFNGWSPSPHNITGNTDCYAQYKYTGSLAVKLVERTLSGAYENTTVEAVGNYVFYKLYTLTGAEFPSATEIGTYAFAECYHLTTASFPAATTIGSSAFQSCLSLTTASFPAATTIGAGAFRSCPKLTTVSVPAATTIGAGAFTQCTKLTAASFPAATSIGSGAFAGCYSLATVSFPVLTKIDSRAFSGCRELTEVCFPAVTTIESSAFADCTKLTTASFPAATKIGSGAFAACRGLTALILGASSVCSIVNTAFSSVFNSTPILSGTGTVYVPASLVAAYQSAGKWSSVAAQISAIEDSEFYNGGE